MNTQQFATRCAEHAALRRAVEAAFTPGSGTSSIGAEVELHVLDPHSHLPLPRDLVRTLLPAGIDRVSSVSFEPGGQLELSFHPQSTTAELTTVVERTLRRLEAAVRDHAEVHLTGTHPSLSADELPLVTPTPRYLAMQEFFDRVGPDGRRMMRSTASLQVCVDLLPGLAGREQWLVANLAAPVLAAAYPNSSGPDGHRTRIWCGVDYERSAYDGRSLDLDDPIGAYFAFATRAQRLLREESRDPAYHLSTLFPPVRPRGGYLEIRCLDAQPVARFGEVASTVTTLMYDARVRRSALELLSPRADRLPELWRLAAAGYHPDTDDLLALVAGTRVLEAAS